MVGRDFFYAGFLQEASFISFQAEVRIGWAYSSVRRRLLGTVPISLNGLGAFFKFR